jgi:hypothetical protein
MSVCVGQPSGAFRAPHRVESADHMAPVENGGNIEFRTIHLCRLRYTGVYLPARTLETEKRGAPVDVHARYPAKATGSAHDDAEVLVLKLKWPLLPRSLDLNQVVLVLWKW